MRTTNNSWHYKLLNEVVKFQEGPGVRNFQFTNKGVKLLNVRNLVDNKLILENTNTCISEEEAYNKYNHFLVDEGDLIIASSGIKADYFHKKIAFVEKKHLPLCLNTSTIRFKPLDKSVIDMKFFRYCLMTKYFANQVQHLMTGSAQLNFGPSHLKQMKIPLPPLPIQKQIVEILEKADEAKQIRKEANKLIDEFLQSLFIEMFGDPVKNPKGWSVKKVKDISSLVTSGSTPLGGNSNYLSNGILFIRSQNVLMNRIDYSDIVFIDESIHNRMLRTWVKSNDVLFNITGASIGRIAYFNGKNDSANVNQHVCIIRTIKEKVNHIFLSYLISSDSFQSRIISQNAGATRQAFNFERVKNFDIILPPLILQQQFAEIVNKTEALKEKQKQSEQELENLFQSLMQRAFKGELIL